MAIDHLPNDAADRLDPQTVDLLSLRPTLRTGLQIERHHYRGVPCYLISDPASGQIHRLGNVEFQFFQSLDGQRCVSDILEQIASEHGNDAIDDNDVVNLLGWMLESGLIQTSSAETSDGQTIQERIEKRRQKLTVGMLFQRIRIGNPDRYVAKMTSVIPNWFAKIFLAIVGVLFAVASVMLVGNVDLITEQALQTISADRWLSLLITFALLKMIHEIGHALVCRLMGCPVRECGIAFVLLIPMPFVDVSAASMLRSKWKRIAVSAAGMAIEWTVAAASLIAFLYTDDPVWKTRWLDIIFAAGVTSVFFNINPLMRFDGYYMLADYLEIPNLGSEGQQAVKTIAKRLFFGGRGQITRLRQPRRIIASYGIAAMLWRCFITITLLIAASQLLNGWGQLLVIGFVIATATGKLASCLETAKESHFWSDCLTNRSLLRPALVSTLIIGGLTIVAWIPVGRSMSVPAAIRYGDTQAIHCAESGTVAFVGVDVGQAVRRGDVLVQLYDAKLESEIRQATARHKASKHRSRRHHSSGEMSKFQIELVTESVIAEQITELQKRMAALAIIAPIDGIVLDGDLESIKGRFLRRGDVLCRIGNPASIEITALISADDANRFVEEEQVAGQVRVDGLRHHHFSSTFSETNKKASDEIRFSELTAVTGGSIAVVQTPGVDRPKLARPHVEYITTIPIDHSQATLSSLRPGCPATVKLKTQSQPLYRSLIDQYIR